MATIKITEDEKQTLDTNLNLMRFLAEVQTKNIKEDITSDFVLAKLSDQDKEGISNMTVNAYLAVDLTKRIARKGKTYKYNKEENQWEIKEGQQQEKILEIKDEIFGKYMRKATMICVLNRNVTKNFLIKQITGITEQEETQEPKDINTHIKEGVEKVTKKEKEE